MKAKGQGSSSGRTVPASIPTVTFMLARSRIRYAPRTKTRPASHVPSRNSAAYSRKEHAMLIVDAQVHIWGRGLPTNPSHRQISSFSKDDLLKEMDEAGVNAALIHPP